MFKERFFVGYSNNTDLRYHTSSGGLTRELISHLFDTDEIDGIYTLRFDEESKKYIGDIYTTKQDYLENTPGSIYNEVDFYSNLPKVKEYKKIAIILSWCQKKYIEKHHPEIIPHLLYIGMICGWSYEDAATEYFKKKMKLPEDAYVKSFRGKGPVGKFLYERPNGEQFTFTRRPDKNKDRKMFLAQRTTFNKYYNQTKCLFCEDHINRDVGISIGDAWLARFRDDTQGTNIVVIRNQFFLDIFMALKEQGTIWLDEVTNNELEEAQSKAICESTVEKKYIQYREDPSTLSKKDRREIKKFFFIRKQRNNLFGRFLITCDYIYKYKFFVPKWAFWLKRTLKKILKRNV